jgi:hypothetical protein
MTRLVPLTFGLLFATLGAGPGIAAGMPFDTLSGTWAGGGNLAYDSGAPDKLECLGYYKSSGAGSNLSIAIRCKGDTKLELRTKLDYQGGKLSGTWEERTYNASGEATGTATENKLNVQFSGSLSGSMAIEFTPSTQSISVSILTTESGLKGAQVNLARH